MTIQGHSRSRVLESVEKRTLAKAIGQNEMPFGTDTLVVPSNIVLDRGPCPRTGKGDFWVGNSSSQWCRLSPNYLAVVISNVMRFLCVSRRLSDFICGSATSASGSKSILMCFSVLAGTCSRLSATWSACLCLQRSSVCAASSDFNSIQRSDEITVLLTKADS